METFPAVIAEDRWALDQQQAMFDYPDDGYREVFLRPDRALRRAREILMRLEEAERILVPPEQVVETPATAA
jgi:vanillate O-demethylase monooxygenase subunit